MDYVLAFNAFETVLWLVFGLTLILRSVRQRADHSRLGLWSGVVFLIFSGSEVTEMWSGACWRPWWLFVWKAACITFLVVAAITWYRKASRHKPSDD